MLVLDHLAVSSATLEEGADWVAGRLGVAVEGGGKHAEMGTHNRLLSLGDLYLEVIAVDPGAARPGWPRWFDLDRFEGAPRLTNWVARCDDLEAELAVSPPGTGEVMALARGAYRWRMAVPGDGVLPFDGAFPALISWQGPAHPAQQLTDRGVRLRRLEIGHPEAEALKAALAGRLDDPRVVVVPAAEKSLHAEFDTPHGARQL